MYISKLEIKLIQKLSDTIYKQYPSEIITEEDINEAKNNLDESLSDRFELCSALETIYYCYSVILSEVRDKKRKIMASLFEQNPKLSQEKSVLQEKLDANLEYANIHKIEEQLFQFIGHIQNIKNNIVYVYKVDSEVEINE